MDKSYEYCRKVVAGEVLPSPELNAAICKFLGFDVEKMWTLAEQERAFKRFGRLAGIDPLVTPPPDDRLRDLWPRLKPEEKKRVQRFVEALIEVREADELDVKRQTLRERAVQALVKRVQVSNRRRHRS
jgi:hypothetical protein